MIAEVAKMQSKFDAAPRKSPQARPGLTPWGTVAGLGPVEPEECLIGAQSALNRFQVWLGDIFIAIARSQKVRRATGPGRAALKGRAG